MNNSARSTGIRDGLLGAAVVILYFALFYSIRKDLFLNPAVQWSSLIIYAAFMWRTAKYDHDSYGAKRDFRERLRPPFAVFLLINMGYWLFYYGLHLADTELIHLETQAMLDSLRQQLTSGTGDPQQSNALREKILELEKAPVSQPLGPILLRYGVGALGGFGIAAAIAALQKQPDQT